MKITAFFPVILVRDLEAGLKEYEAMGFERKHTTENFAMKSHVLELNGNRVEIFTSQMDMFNMPDGYYGMRINVRDFEEGVDFSLVLEHFRVARVRRDYLLDQD